MSGTLALCRQMEKAGVRKIIFSSSATVYGDSDVMPLHENMPTGIPSNPYGHSKLMVETILKGLAESDPRWSVALLKYFNPIGAHPSGEIGEDPLGIPNNLVPFVSQVAAGKHPEVKVMGNDYPTEDGTGMRDYMKDKSGVFACNLGTGSGTLCA